MRGDGAAKTIGAGPLRGPQGRRGPGGDGVKQPPLRPACGRVHRWLIGALLLGSIGCEIGPQSGIGLRLPEGDVERGAQTFRALGCPACHVIEGEPAPDRPPDAPRPIVLGGKADHIATHGELVTSIVNPSHGHPRRYPREEVFEQGLSKMKNFNDRMTVEQLLDLTSYLQSKYELDLDALYGP